MSVTLTQASKMMMCGEEIIALSLSLPWFVVVVVVPLPLPCQVVQYYNYKVRTENRFVRV